MGLSITTVDKPTVATSAIPPIVPHDAHYTGHLIIHCISIDLHNEREPIIQSTMLQ